MKTRITELLRIKYPIVQGAMNYVSLPSLVAAVSNAGGLGILCLMSLPPEDARKSIREVKALTDKPFGVNIVRVTPYYREYVRIILEENVSVLSHGIGDPFAAIGMKKPPGIIFMPTVGTVRQAIDAEKLGADAVIATGSEAGGHVGRVPNVILIPEIVAAVKVPVVAGGGYCDGKGLVSALALGAEGIDMGSRFALTEESPLHPRAKEALLKARSSDIITTSKQDGFRLACFVGRKIRNYRGWWSRPWEVIPSLLQAKKDSKLTFKRSIEVVKQMKKDKVPIFQWVVGWRRIVDGCTKGDIERGLIPSGPVVGRIHDILTVKEVMDKTISEATALIREMADRIR